ncbi:hypothetical protein ACTXT7_007502 [Hymenolepis weldensis]
METVVDVVAKMGRKRHHFRSRDFIVELLRSRLRLFGWFFNFVVDEILLVTVNKWRLESRSNAVKKSGNRDLAKKSISDNPINRQQHLQ